MKKHPGKYPEGFFVGRGMGVFMAVGLGIGVALDNLPVGLVIGLAIGLIIGSTWEKKYKDKGLIRKLTKKEEEIRKYSVWAGLILLVLGIITGLSFYFLS